MPISKDIAIITPWYPGPQSPFGGAFVQAMVEATAPGCHRATVYHCDPWLYRVANQGPSIAKAHRKLLGRALRAVPTVGGADLVYVPVPMQGPMTFGARAHRHAESLRLALRGKPIEAPVVHAHVGLRGGWVALQNARPDARVHVTEHATFLPEVLAEADSRDMYDEVIERCASFHAVGEPVRQPLIDAFPHHAAKIGIIANAIAFGAGRTDPVTELRRWLYVGSLNERKGVRLLVEAFAACHEKDPELTLSLLGSGVLRDELVTRVAELGIADSVTFIGGVPPDQALKIIGEHDLLVHPSRLETFGMTIVEAVAAGTPVLVTRSGGPQTTLKGIEDAAGELIDVTDDPATIVEGYLRLRDRFPDGLDLPRARQVLADRNGYPAVRNIHHGLWFGTDS